MNSVTLITGYDRTDLLEALESNGWTVRRVVVARSRKYLPLQGSFLTEAHLRGIEVLCIAPGDLGSMAEMLRDDNGVLLSAGYPFFIPAAVTNAFRFAVNVHPTLLPRHRGKYLNWILLDGETESGVTLHQITNNLDAGPIVKQLSFPVSPFDTLASLHRKSRELEPKLILESLQELVEGSATFVEQDEALATTHLKQRVPEDSRMSPSTTLADALNVVRGSDASRFPAYFIVSGQRVRVRMDRMDRLPGEEDLL